MADEPRADKGAEKDTQPEPVPSSEQKTPEPEDQAGASPKGESQPGTKGKELKLPEDAKDRTTEQFDKLKTQLAEERERRIRLEQATQLPKPQIQPTKQGQYPDYYNPETGEVDVNKLDQRDKAVQAELQQLRQSVQGQRDAERVKQEKEAFDVYPSLNPNDTSKFDSDFHDAVSGYLTNAYLKGDVPTFKEAADKVMKLASKVEKKAEKEGAKKALEQLTPKEQASVEEAGRSDRRTQVDENLDTLRKRSRTGNKDSVEAIVERLKGVPSIGK